MKSEDLMAGDQSLYLLALWKTRTAAAEQQMSRPASRVL
jgi:hypothetical protein